MPFEFLEDLEVGEPIKFDPLVVHPLYADMADEWEKCRDCYGGEKSVKSKGTKYLPMLNAQSESEYEKYKMRAQFYGATSRTVEAYLGMIFRKPVTFKAQYNGEGSMELNKFITRFLNNLTVDSKNINEFAHQVTEELIVTNRLGVLLDMPRVDDDLSIYEYEERGIRPTLSMYRAENILNWFTIKENGEDLPILYVLYEPYQGFKKNTFESEMIDGYRILYLENWQDPENRRYKNIRLKAKNRLVGDAGPISVDSIDYPTNNGRYFRHIPFYVLSDQGLDYERVRQPMISDLANVNIGHYRNSADLENELHFVSLKTIAYPAWDTKTYGQPKVGGAIATPKDAIPVLLEPTSDSSIREEMTLKEARLAVLGAERISQKQRYLPSASVAEITASAEASVIQNFLTSLNQALNRIIHDAIEWARPFWPEYSQGELELDIQVNTDLAENSLSGADLVNFIRAFQMGGISLDTLFYNLDRREMYPPGWTKEKEWDALLKTRDTVLTEAMQDIVAGKTENHFFSEGPEGSEGEDGRQTASSGRGEDVTVTEIGTTSRVRSS
jgi:hypothetical protein